MDANRFDAWTLALTAAGSRRALVGALVGAALGALGGGLGGGRQAAAGDRESGQACKRNAQCITEICAGPRNRKTCRCADGLKTCPATSNNCCVAPLICRDGTCVNHCQSGRKDRDESDVDCGGADCPGCEFGHQCNSPDDCANGLLFCRDRAGDGTAKKVCVECADGAISADDACFALHGEERPFCVRNKCRQCRDEVDCAAGEECRDGVCKAAGTCAAGQDRCQVQQQQDAICNGTDSCVCHQTSSGEAFCGDIFGGECFACDVDTDCDAVTGEGSACVDLSGPECLTCDETNFRACVVPCPTSA